MTSPPNTSTQRLKAKFLVSSSRFATKARGRSTELRSPYTLRIRLEQLLPRSSTTLFSSPSMVSETMCRLSQAISGRWSEGTSIMPRKYLPSGRRVRPKQPSRPSNSQKTPAMQTSDAAGGQGFNHNPFERLSSEGLPASCESSPADCGQPTEGKPARKNRGRVDIIRQTAGRGGKTVTVVTGFAGIGLPEKEKLARAMQKACGTGGTVKEGRIEIQGDKREAVAHILTEAGFRPVFAGD